MWQSMSVPPATRNTEKTTVPISPKTHHQATGRCGNQNRNTIKPTQPPMQSRPVLTQCSANLKRTAAKSDRRPHNVRIEREEVATTVKKLAFVTQKTILEISREVIAERCQNHNANTCCHRQNTPLHITTQWFKKPRRYSWPNPQFTGTTSRESPQ